MSDPGYDLGRLGRLISLVHEGGLGIYVQPIAEGEQMGGFGSDDRAQFNGWIIGTISSVGGDTLAVGPTIADAVEAALRVWLDV